MGGSAGAVDFSPSTAFSFLTADEVRYLRGDQSREGQAKNGSITWRKRSALLGDVVNCAVYSGAPSRQMTGDGYKDFYDDNKNRTPAVFVGANDGMLADAFNATTGDELFAFIPKTMAPKLASLTESTYTSNHQNFVDGLLSAKELDLGTTKTKADWKTVLLGANGESVHTVFLHWM